MQTLEAMISLVFFIWTVSLLMSSYSVPPADDSLYRMQIAGDAWRVLYLRGELQDLESLEQLEPALEPLASGTGLCIFINGIEATNCRGGVEGHDVTVSLLRTVILDGEPTQITFSLGN